MGSTAIGVAHRERNRRAKLKQLQNDVPISAELSHDTIDQFTTLQLSPHDTYDQACVHERNHISNWMPPLNWPFISQHLRLEAQGWQFTQHRIHFYSRHRRLFQRHLTQAKHPARAPPLHLYQTPRLNTITQPYQAHQGLLESFEAAKQLRSGRHRHPARGFKP